MYKSLDGGKEKVPCVKGDRAGVGGGYTESLGSGVPQRPLPLFSTKLFICLPCLFSDTYSFSLEMKLSASHRQPLHQASSRKRHTK